MWLSGDMLQHPVKGARVWADGILWICKDLNCDAIVYYQLLGCLHMGSLAKLVAEVAEKEMGIPTLVITGKELDATALSPAEFDSQLTEFVDIQIDRKKHH
jgi:hypothetical protein